MANLLQRCFVSTSLTASRHFSKLANESDILATFRAKYALPAGTSYRPVRHDDKQKILQITPDLFDGLDYLPAYYDRYIAQPNRRSVVLVEDATQQIVSFNSFFVVDDGRTVVGSGARVRSDYRGRSLLRLSYPILQQSATEFPNVERLVGVTRSDQAVLEPRYSSNGLQRNRFIGTNHYLIVRSRLADLERATSNIRDSDLHFSPLPLSNTSLAFAKSKKLRRVAFGGQYVVIGGNPYSVDCASNFTDSSTFGARAYVGSQTERTEQLSTVDSISFVLMYPAAAGIHVRVFAYSSSVEAARKLVKSSLASSLGEVHKLSESREAGVGTHVQKSDMVYISVAFPASLDALAMRKWLYEAGFQPGTNGTDIQRQYLHQDESLTAIFSARSKASSKSS